MLLWIAAVHDRSKSDTDYLSNLFGVGWDNMTSDQQSAWISGLKGSINTSDLNRIENNVQLLSDVLKLNLTTYYGNVPEIPNETYYAKLLSNVSAIVNAYITYTYTPSVPDRPLLNYSKWNDIEQILDDIHTILLSNFFYYCGSEIYCGDSTGLLL